MRELEMLRAQLCQDHLSTVGVWKRRMRKAVFTSSVLFVCVVAFSAMHFGWGMERAGMVALGLIVLCLLQARELTKEQHEWTRPLSTALEGTYALLLTKAPDTAAFRNLGRPLYVADHLALQAHVDAWHEGGGGLISASVGDALPSPSNFPGPKADR